MSFDFAGSWKNEIGAVLVATVGDDFGVSGTFTNALGEVGKITGFVNEQTLAFSAVFPHTADTAGSTGTMLGQPIHEGDAAQFRAWWHFRMLNDPSPSWATVRTGEDTFVRINSGDRP